MTKAREEADLAPSPRCVPYIYHLVQFKKNQAKVQILLNFSNKVNIITLIYVANLGFKVRLTDVGAYKINGSILKIFEMVLASFQIKEEHEKIWFFQKTFLVTNISMEMILNIFFLIFSNANILFAKQELIQRLYILAKAILITKRVKVINYKKFVAVILDLSKGVFVIQVSYIDRKMSIHL